MADVTGAGGGPTYEEVVLELKTNFADALKGGLSEYRSFQSSIGAMSRQISTSVSQLHGQIAQASQAMVEQNTRAMSQQFNNVRSQMRQAAGEMSNLLEGQTRAYSVINDYQQRFKEQLARTNVPEDLQKKALQSITQGMMAELNTLSDKMASGMGRAAAKSATVVASASQSAMQGVYRVANDAEDRVKNLGNTVRSMMAQGADPSTQLSYLKGFESQYAKVEAVAKQQQQRMVQAERDVQIARQALIQQTNDKLIEGNKRYLASAENSFAEVRSAAQSTQQRQVNMEKQLQTVRAEVSQAAIQGAKDLQTSLAQTSPQKMVSEMAAVRAQIATQSRSSSKEVTASIQQQNSAVQELARTYQENMRKIQTSISTLQSMTRRGLISDGNVQQDIAALQRMQAEYKNFAGQVVTVARQAANDAGNQLAAASQSVNTKMMDTLRNFRWQVAGVIYLATQAIRGIKTIFFGTMDEIMNFRKDAMSLAASMAGQFFTPLEQSYTRLYDYSRDLMNQLQLQAAKTHLTLEDMVMLTKTFAQAGWIPKSGDVQKIAAIGTAIKVLTEGMANAGVQMRQELYAVIQGRARATDQLAKFLELQGVNIKEIMKQAQSGQVNLIDELYAKLQPFAILNKTLEDDYRAQKNQLSAIWDILKRIGGEGVMVALTASIKEVNKSLMDINTGALTERGEAVAVTIFAVLESIRAVFAAFITIAEDIFTIFSSIFKVINSIGSVFANVTGNAKETSRYAKEWQTNLAGVGQTFALIVTGVDGLLTGVATWAVMVKSIIDGMRAIYYWTIGNREAATKAAEESGKVWDNIAKLGGDMLARARQRFTDIHTSVEGLGKAIDNAGKKAADFPADMFQQMKIPTAEIDELTKHLDNLRADAEEGADKWREKIKQVGDTYARLSTPLKAAFDDIKAKMAQTKDPETLKNLEAGLQRVNKYMGELNEWYTLSVQKFKNKISVIDEREAAKVLRLQQEYETLMQKLQEKPQTPLERINKEISDLQLKITQMAEKNPYANLTELQKALDAKRLHDTSQALEQMAQEAQKFRDQIAGHDVQTNVAKIHTELAKVADEIKKSTTLSREQKQELLAMIPAAEARRVREERIKTQLELQSKSYELLGQQASLLELSIRPIDKQYAEQLRLIQGQLQFINSMTKAMEDFKRTHGETSDEWKQYQAIMRQSMDLQTQLFKEQMNNVQHPFWAEMKNLAKSWADETAGAIADVIMDFENAAKTLDSLFKNIVKQALTAAIKNMFTNNLLNMFGGGGSPGSTNKDTAVGLGGAAMSAGGGGISGFFKNLFGGGNKEGGTEAAGGGASTLIGALTTSSTTQVTAITSLGAELTATITTLNVAVVTAIEAAAASIVAAISAQGAGSALGGAAGAMGGLGGAASEFADLAPGIAFAEGGMITEPIVGMGLNSGSKYTLGEAGTEMVVPSGRMGGSTTHVNVGLSIQAIDTKSGVDFLMKHSDLLEAQMTNALAGNRSLRRGIRGAF